MLCIALGVIHASADPDILPPFDRLQPALLQEAFARLDSQPKGGTDIYAVGVAGWWDQDVFRKELDGAFGAISKVLPVSGRTVRLINRPETTAEVPLASRANIAAAVHAVAARMNKEDDVLVLAVTTHGVPGAIMLQMPGGDQVGLRPNDFAWLLDREGIKNRVVVVSACYSGVFVRPLANDNTIVITAADEKNTSFGCGAGRAWTYFGDAFFNQGLRPGADFKRAFDHARTLITGWERLDRLPPSNPQGHFGRALMEKLTPIFESMPRSADP